MHTPSVEIDIQCDSQQLGEYEMPFALLSEARDPAMIDVGAIVITADEEDPVFAKVFAITQFGNGPKVVHLELLQATHSTTPTPYAEHICSLRKTNDLDGVLKYRRHNSHGPAVQRVPRQLR